LGWARTGTPFAQRLLYERLIAPIIPVAERRDLKPPAFLHLDPADRFPRVTVREAGEGPEGLFGPFRNRRGADKARDEVNRLFELRPCDSVFEPDPALPLGRGCLYAQVRSCAAPCLGRLSEEQYRARAVRATAWLADPAARTEASASLPASVVRIQGSRMVVVSVGRKEIALFPVREGRVLEEATLSTTAEEIDATVTRLEWPESAGPDDWPWLAVWMAGPRGRGSCLQIRDPVEPDALAAAVRAALPVRFARPSGGDNVGTSRGEA
jgi:hypothetical protein